MRITCFGPRGSIPAPSFYEDGVLKSTAKYGGNTSCYYVEAGPFRVILDCGSGVRRLGKHLMKTGAAFGNHFICKISHYHWDHLQGLPFCVPMFIGSNVFHFHGFIPDGHEMGPRPVVEDQLYHQQSTPHFPVPHQSMPSGKRYYDHNKMFSETYWYYLDGDGSYQMTVNEGDLDRLTPDQWIKFTTIPLHHPNGCLGWRIEHCGKVAVYATDNEPLRHNNVQLTKHGQDADWLVTDGQFTELQLAGPTQIFGHGTPEVCVEAALAANVKMVVIHHYDPDSYDEVIDALVKPLKAYAKKIGYKGEVDFAIEGKIWVL